MKLKKGSFRMVHRNFWRWCRASKIRGNTLLILLAIETGPWGAGQYTGCFRLGIYDLMDFTGLNHAEVSRAVDSLERCGAIVFDKDRQAVYVHGMLERQCPNFASSENTLQGIVNHIERMPEDSRAISAFIEAQSNVPELFELFEGYPPGGLREDLDTRDLRLEDLDTRDKESIIAEKTSALMPSPSSSSSPSNGNGKSKSVSKRSILSPKDARSIIDTLEQDARLLLIDLTAQVREYEIEPERAYYHALMQSQVEIPEEILDRLFPMEAAP